MSLATPYEGQRRRLLLMERLEALRFDTSLGLARDRVARALRLTSEQLVNIRKRRLKDLYGDIKSRIDEGFVDVATDLARDLEHELALARASGRGVDPRLVAQAETSKHALEQLIAEAQEDRPC